MKRYFKIIRSILWIALVAFSLLGIYNLVAVSIFSLSPIWVPNIDYDRCKAKQDGEIKCGVNPNEVKTCDGSFWRTSYCPDDKMCQASKGCVTKSVEPVEIFSQVDN